MDPMPRLHQRNKLRATSCAQLDACCELRVARNTQLVAGNKQLAARNMMLVARNKLRVARSLLHATSCDGVNAAYQFQ